MKVRAHLSDTETARGFFGYVTGCSAGGAAQVSSFQSLPSQTSVLGGNININRGHKVSVDAEVSSFPVHSDLHESEHGRVESSRHLLPEMEVTEAL